MRVKIIKVITFFMAIALVISVMAIDSNSCIPLITAGISLIWLCIIALANTDPKR